MVDRKKIKKMAELMVTMGKEILLELKRNPDLFYEGPHKQDKIVARSKASRELYVTAQNVMKKWFDLWEKEYGTQPIVKKHWVPATANLLKTKSVADLVKAVENYFDTEDEFVVKKIQFDYGYFLTNINKYLPTG
jgi:hypothetical protein